MIGVHLLSEQVVNWYRFQNEMIGVHLLSVGTSSELVCMIGVHLLSVRTSSVLPLVQMMMVKQLHYY